MFFKPPANFGHCEILPNFSVSIKAHNFWFWFWEWKFSIRRWMSVYDTWKRAMGKEREEKLSFFQSVCFVLVQFLYVLNSVDLESVFLFAWECDGSFVKLREEFWVYFEIERNRGCSSSVVKTFLWCLCEYFWRWRRGEWVMNEVDRENNNWRLERTYTYPRAMECVLRPIVCFFVFDYRNLKGMRATLSRRGFRTADSWSVKSSI